MANEYQQELIDQLRQTISADRIGTYLVAAGFDDAKALKLYIWNALVGESFHLPIQGAEVALRNRINDALCNRFGAEWWQAEGFLRIADHERMADLETAKRRIKKRNSALCTAQIVANVSFGFWTGLLAPRYNPEIWSHELRFVFPNLPQSENRYSLSERVQQVNFLRNRIWHHEPVFKMDLLREQSELLELIEWICPAMLLFVKPHCRLQALMRLRPR